MIKRTWLHKLYNSVREASYATILILKRYSCCHLPVVGRDSTGQKAEDIIVHAMLIKTFHRIHNCYKETNFFHLKRHQLAVILSYPKAILFANSNTISTAIVDIDFEWFI